MGRKPHSEQTSLGLMFPPFAQHTSAALLYFVPPTTLSQLVPEQLLQPLALSSVKQLHRNSFYTGTAQPQIVSWLAGGRATAGGTAIAAANAKGCFAANGDRLRAAWLRQRFEGLPGA
jgi:hypothetical protein